MTRIAWLFVLFALAGCGNKGPLVRASAAPAAADAPVPEPATEEPAPADPVPGTSGTPAR